MIKKNSLLVFFMCIAFSSGSVVAQVPETPVCYDQAESETPDFWLNHFYYAKCTDFSDKTAGGGHAGGLVYDGNPNYIAFNFYGGLDFDGIYVSKDGTYRVEVVYGIHACAGVGAWADLKVNGEKIRTAVFPRLPGGGAELGTIAFDVNLRAGQANLIQFISVKDFPVFLGIQLSLSESEPTPEVTCPDKAETEVPDFWLTHFYYAKCADYASKAEIGGHAGGMPYENNPNYVAFNMYGGLDFDGIYVSKEGTYHVEVVYGIHDCVDPGAGANLVVNGEEMGSVVFPTISGLGSALDTIEFDVNLRTGQANLISLISVKDYPVFSGIQICPTEDIGTLVAQVETMPYSVSWVDGMLTVSNLTGMNDLIQIHTLDGRLINSATSNASEMYSASLAAGLYIVNVNGYATKIVVE